MLGASILTFSDCLGGESRLTQCADNELQDDYEDIARAETSTEDTLQLQGDSQVHAHCLEDSFQR